jgi:hypothetical protein
MINERSALKKYNSSLIILGFAEAPSQKGRAGGEVAIPP